jgi:formyl-CoA transferase
VVDELIAGWTRLHSRDDIAQRLLAMKVPCSSVRHLREVIADKNMHARGSLQWIDHPQLGRVVLPHSPLVFEGVERPKLEPSLPLGACNGEIFGDWLGHSAEELAAFRSAGVIL